MRPILIDYTNWKGVRHDRYIRPLQLRWGSTEYHTKPQWLLDAIDLDKGEHRTFAVEDIHGVISTD